MGLDDGKLTVFTGLFLAVAVGTIAKYGDVLMDKFGGQQTAAAVDDVFTTRAGTTQPLYVLLNDVRPGDVRQDQLQVVQRPSCGNLRRAGRSFLYEASSECIGRQTFTYCIADGSACKPAQVALRVQPGDGIRQVPVAQAPVQQDQDSGVMVASASDTAPRRQLGALAPASNIGTSNIARPDRVVTAQVQDRVQAPTSFEVASTSANTAPDTTGIALPRPPIGALDRAALPEGGVDLSLVVSDRTGASNRRPSQAARAVDPNCEPTLHAEPAPGAMIQLSLSAPCHPQARMVVVHERIAFTDRTQPDGSYTVQVPALVRDAAVAVRFDDGAMAMAKVDMREVSLFYRVAIQWSGDHDLDLHALQFGAQPHTPGHIWAGNPRSPAEVVTSGGGFAVQLGDATVDEPMQVEVYSHRHVSNTRKRGNIALSVQAHSTAADCGQPVVLFSQSSTGGLTDSNDGLQFSLPACGQESASLVLRNAVRDMLVARR